MAIGRFILKLGAECRLMSYQLSIIQPNQHVTVRSAPLAASGELFATVVQGKGELTVSCQPAFSTLPE